MVDTHIEKILEAYKSREEIDKFAHLASYVDTFEEEEVEPLTDIISKINTTNEAIESQTASLLKMLNQLYGNTLEADTELKQFLEKFKG